MRRKLSPLLLVTLLALLLAPAVLASYTVVLKNGRRIEARSRYVVDKGVVKFVGLDGTTYEFPRSEVNLLATRSANATAENTRRKVWTNEDLHRLSGDVPISVMGGRRSSASASSDQAEGGADAKGQEGGEDEPPPESTREYWQDRLKPLRDELTKIDRQLRGMNAGGRQAASNVVDVNTNAAGVDATGARQRLERRRTEIQQKISELQAEARRKGVPPGYVR